MKKGKVLTKSQFILAGMVLLLGAAVWLNTKYSGQISAAKNKYLGETVLVSEETQSPDAVMTGAEAETKENDYFTTAANDRDTAYMEAEALIEETLKNESLSSEEKKAATDKASALAARKINETAVENLLKAKGFEKVLTVISDTGVTVIVQSDGLVANQTVQIQDAVINQCGVNLNNIKIVTVDG